MAAGVLAVGNLARGAEQPSRAGALEMSALVFEEHIQPILAAKCSGCHGAETQKAGLNLSVPRTLLAGSDSGEVIVAGRPDESLLWEMIRDEQMPPPGEPQLTSIEADRIREWLAGGARFHSLDSTERSVTDEDIIPLMLLRCTACHGTRRQEGGLDLRSKAAMLQGGESGPAVVPGNAEESLIVRRIRAEEMPPRRQLVAASVKPMTGAELARLAAWIDAGLPEAPRSRAQAAAHADPLVSEAERRFWSFEPPQLPAVPRVDDAAPIRNPVDAFILAGLQASGLSLAPEADRATLVRRLYFDLRGLPPAPQQAAAFVSDQDPEAYEKLLDRLLASPRYGERWGRHWLDVAGYADSEGAQNEDRVRPQMWRYRDYVVRAFNADKSYERFLWEQIAGDELADYAASEFIDEPLYDNLVATGFLRTAPDRTFADITNFVPDRLEVIAEEVQILGSAVLGLTIQCARCHSHKFDPIPQRDYYRLAAVLKDAYDEHDWLKPEERTLPHVTSEERRRWEAAERAIDRQIEALKAQLEEQQEEGAKQTLEQQIKELEGQRQPEPRIRALWSRGEPSPTYLLNRGNYLTPGREVEPGVPGVLSDGTHFTAEPPWPGAATTGRRLALARWLTRPQSPAAGLVARVIVNRIWKHHFGRGLVATLGNFGTAGAPPTHPELLDWLAVELMRSGWSIKHMHRLILTSQTYRQSSQVSPESLGLDPEGLLLSRMPLRRMEAEVLRDSLLFVAGQLNAEAYGPPDDVDARGDGLVLSKRGRGGWRRSIYVLQRRTKMPTILESFDYPQMGPNCVERGESIVALQALHLLNNEMVYELAERFAERVRREAGEQPARQVERVHAICFSRPPTEDERWAALQSIEQLASRWATEVDAESAAQRALVNYCHAVMNSAAFLYID